MQILAAPWLAEVVRQPGSFPELVATLEAAGVMREGHPLISGCLINMNNEFSALMDVGAPPSAAEGLFGRLVDSRILGGQLASIQVLSSVEFGREFDFSEISFVVPPNRSDLVALIDSLGAKQAYEITGAELEKWIRSTEDDVRRVLYDLRPVEWEQFRTGPVELRSLRLLRESSIYVAGEIAELTPLTLLDDVHLLHREQRRVLHGMLATRAAAGVWLAERTEVLNPEALLTFDNGSFLESGEQGRDYNLIDLTLNPNTSQGAYHKVLRSVALRRAATDLQLYTETKQTFFDFLDTERSEPSQVAIEGVERELAIAAEDSRYTEWTSFLSSINNELSIRNARAGIALIESSQRRQQQELFLEIKVPLVELKKKLGSAEREAAALLLSKEYDLPAYYGSDALFSLANENVSQLLRISADLFDQVLTSITRGNDTPTLSPSQQDRTIRRASDALWKEIPNRLANGRDIQNVISGVASFARKLNHDRPISYAPGISGFALTMRDVDSLLEQEKRREIPGGESLLHALANAVAHNYLTKREDVPRGANSERRMVFYLNRLLCPYFGLPLGRGGYKTRGLREVAGWIGERPHVSTSVDSEYIDVNQGELFGDW